MKYRFCILLILNMLLVSAVTLHAQYNMEWAASTWGTAAKAAYGVATDDSGNVYTAGSFRGKVDFNPATGAADTFFLTSVGGADIFVYKLDAAGHFVWAKRMGGTLGFGTDEAKSIAVDGAGNVYLTGIFFGKADFNPSPDPADTFFLKAGASGYANAMDAYVAKLDKDGNFVWAKQFVGYGDPYASDIESSNQGRAITVDKITGDSYITGCFIGKADFNPSVNPADTFFLTAIDATYGQNMYVAKLDSAGNFVWAKNFGGTSSVQGRGITLDPSGNVLATGYYYNKVDFNPAAGAADTFFLHSAANSMDIFVLKLNSTGEFIWAKSMGASTGSGDLGNDITTDISGNVYTTGYFSGNNADFDPGTGTHIFSVRNYLDIFVSKLDASGDFIWAKQMGSTGAGVEEAGYAISISRSGDVIVGGGFTDTADFNYGGTPHTAVAKGNRDAFMLSLSDNGDLNWLRTFGSRNADMVWGLSIDPSGNIFGAGSYRDTVDFDVPNGLVNTAAGTQTEAFVVKLVCGDTSSSVLKIAICDNSYTLNGETYTQSGIYTQTFPNAAGCDSTLTLDLDLNTITTPVITVAGFVLGTTQAYSNYQWLRNGVGIDGATNSTYTVTANDDYAVAVTNEDGCTDTSDVYEVTNVGVDDIATLAAQVSVYPNPARDVVYISASVPVTATISSVEGRMVLNQRDVRKIDLSGIADGVYILRITDAQGYLLKAEKLVKQSRR